jgi:hypothetical protein
MLSNEDWRGMMCPFSASVVWLWISLCRAGVLAGNFFCLPAGAVSAPLWEVGGVALLIDAKNEGVARWYANYGALPLLDTPLSLLLPMATIRMVLESAGKL